MNDYDGVLGNSVVKSGVALAATGPVIDQVYVLGIAAGMVALGAVLIQLTFRRGKKAYQA